MSLCHTQSDLNFFEPHNRSSDNNTVGPEREFSYLPIWQASNPQIHSLLVQPRVLLAAGVLG